MLYRLFIAVLMSFALALSANAVDFVNLKDFPEWFQESIAREVKLDKTSQLKLEQFNVDAEVIGAYTLADDSDGTWYYTIDIGTPAPVECYVFSEFDGPATSLYSVIDFGLSGAASIYDKALTSKNNYYLNTGVIGDTPFLALDTLYSLGEGSEKLSGVLKAMSAKTDQSLQICMHNEIGYRDSFRQVFESFVKAFTANQQNPEFFESLFKVSLNGIPMGYMQESYAKDADGDVYIVNNTALLIPVDASSIARTDTVSTSWARPDGSLINGSEYTLENGVVTSQFSILHGDEGWQVEGQMQGKAISAKLDHDGWLLSGFGSYLELEILRNAEATSGEFNMWAPSADPTSALPVVLRQIEGDENANFEVDMGALVMKFLADEKGVFRQGSLQQGPVSMNMELIYSKGEPSLP
ncbi:hypothetical protein [Glaciecola sp. SC05]|uniref:hypothetical protein n=1 Tax=Glaciecola sp. SC05 TaxID=1987355 RepID=UPI00352730A9